MSIWFKEYTLEQVAKGGKDTILDTIGIEFVDMGADFLKARMPVDKRTIQPAGLLHGGASVVLAETLGSMASYLMVDPEKFFCVGLEVNANHIRPGLSGYVYGTATPIHLGKSIHIWNIDIVNEKEKLVCKSRLTVMVKKKTK